MLSTIFIILCDIEDTTWQHYDAKFLFESWIIFYFLTWEEEERRNFVPPSCHVMVCLLHKHQWNTKPFHFDIVWLQKVQFIVVIFSSVEKSCYFYMWR